MPNVRTVTTGTELPQDSSQWEKLLKEAIDCCVKVEKKFVDSGYTVQSKRLSTNSFEEYLPLDDESELDAALVVLKTVCETEDALLCLGPARTLKGIKLVPKILAACPKFFCAAAISDTDDSCNLAVAACNVIEHLAFNTTNGEGNFHFCVSFECAPGIPFYPAAYHKGPMSTGIGLECSDVLVAACEKAMKGCENGFSALRALPRYLREEYDAYARPLFELVKTVDGVTFSGFDTSIAPSAGEKESCIYAMELLKLGTFGDSGTIAFVRAVTKGLQSIDLPRVGYCGLMLPVLEDSGLAQRSIQGQYTVQELLLFSSVCAIGLDCVPIPADTDPARLSMILVDMMEFATKLKKPLTARLFLCRDMKPGEITKFNHPHLVNAAVLKL